MNITVRITSNFGNTAIYPACPKSEMLASLAGTKTFTNRALETIKNLGYTVNVAPQTI